MANVIHRVRAGNTAAIHIILKEGGIIYDLSTALAVVVNIPTLSVVDDACVVTDATNGKVDWSPADTTVLTKEESDEHIMLFTVTEADGGLKTFPCPDDIILIVI